MVRFHSGNHKNHGNHEIIFGNRLKKYKKSTILREPREPRTRRDGLLKRAPDQKYFFGAPTIVITSEGREWGVGSVVVESAFFGAPRFSVQRPPKP